jgi:hypothetical protein
LRSKHEYKVHDWIEQPPVVCWAGKNWVTNDWKGAIK